MINTTLGKVAQLLSVGVLHPLRQISHSLGLAASAFRQMVQTSHVGKVVVAAERLGGAPAAIPLRSCPSIAITGGFGGLGVMISRWLVQQSGPAHIHLLSRSGRAANEAAVTGLNVCAACISSTMTDAGSPGDATTALDSASSWQAPPLQAVLHASGVLADSLISMQTAASFRWVCLTVSQHGCELSPAAHAPPQACVCAQARRVTSPFKCR